MKKLFIAALLLITQSVYGQDINLWQAQQFNAPTKPVKATEGAQFQDSTVVNGLFFLSNLLVLTDTTANKPLVINPVTRRVGRLSSWPHPSTTGTGTVLGTGVPGQVAYWDSTTYITGDPSFLWNSIKYVFKVGDLLGTNNSTTFIVDDFNDTISLNVPFGASPTIKLNAQNIYTPLLGASSVVLTNSSKVLTSVATLTVPNGGTGNSSYAVGDILYASGASTLSKRADVATGNALISGGIGVAPLYGKIGLTTHVSGTLGYGNGGTGATAFTLGSIVVAGTTAFVQDNSNFFYDMTNHWLGIGTAVPLYPVHIKNTANKGLTIDRTGTGGFQLLVGTGSGGYSRDENYIISLNTNLHFQTAALTESFTITTLGAGVFDSVPGVNFSIKKRTIITDVGSTNPWNNEAMLQLRSTTAKNTTLSFAVNGTNENGSIFCDSTNKNLNIAGNNRDIVFITGAGGITERARITFDGKFGIGTSAPSAGFHSVGTVKFLSTDSISTVDTTGNHLMVVDQNGKFKKMRFWPLLGGGSVAWSSITGTPTTIGGYGITDAYTKTLSDARYFQISNDLSEGNPGNIKQNISAANRLIPVTIQTGNYSANANEFIPCDVTGGTFTVTLPTTPADATIIGVKITVFASPSYVTVAASGSDGINTAFNTTIRVLALNHGVLLQYSAVAGIWYVISTAETRVSLTGENYLSLNTSTLVLTANAVDLSGTNATGILAAARFPALSGDINTSSGSLSTALGSHVVTAAKFRQSAGLSVVGNATNSTADVTDITAGSDKTVFLRSGSALSFASLDSNYFTTNKWAINSVRPALSAGTGLSYNSVTGVFSITGAGGSLGTMAYADSVNYHGTAGIATVGVIGTGTWRGSLVGSQWGGTGVNNGSFTMTYAGNVSFTGSFNPTFSSSATATYTLPTATSTLLANNLGISGGSTIVGGTASGNNLALSTTSNATKGKITFGTSAYDEVNNRLGIGTASPSLDISVVKSAATAQFNMTSYNSAGSNRCILFFQTGEGTSGSPTNVAGADLMGEFIGAGYAGGAFRNVAGMNFRVPASPGTIGSGNCPSEIYWEVTPLNSVSRAEMMRLSSQGGLYVGGAVLATAIVHIAAGSATASTAPLKLTTGTVNTTPEAGALEYSTPTLSFTNGGAKRQEIPLIQQTRVSTQFDKTSSTALADITGLTATLVAGKKYRFEADLYTTSNVGGGVQAAIAGTCTATAIVYEGLAYNAGAITQTRGAALAAAVGAVTAVTAAYIHIVGLITVNAAGTLTVQFAQNASNGAASSVLVGSTFVTTEIN